MAKFRVTAPDGTPYMVTAPDDATPDQVVQFAQSQFAQAAPIPRPAPILRPDPIARPDEVPPQRRQAPVPPRSMPAQPAPQRQFAPAQPLVPQGPPPAATAAPPVQQAPEPPAQPPAAATAEPSRLGQFAQPQLPPAAPPQPPANPWSDALKSFGVGVGEGVIGLSTIPGNVEALGRMGINAAGNQFGSGDLVSKENVLPHAGHLQAAVESLTGPFYKPQTTAGEYARTAGQFAPNAVVPVGGPLGRVVGGVVAPALASETAGQLTKETAMEPWARAGAALLAPWLANGMAAAVSPLRIDPTRQAAVNTLRNEGVTALTAGDVTGRRPLRWAESVARDTPFGGGRAEAAVQAKAEQFTQAALRRAGIAADRATPDVIDQGFVRAGRQFDQIERRSQLSITPQLENRLQTIATDYERSIGAPAPIVRQLADEIATIRNNVATNGGGNTAIMPGERYVSWRSQIDRLSRGAGKGGDWQLSAALGEMREALDTAVLRGLPVADRAAWRAARQEYRNLLVLERASTAAGAEAAGGVISPQQLRQATIAVQGRRNYARGRGDYADLSHAGNLVMEKLPQSGTAPRQMMETAARIPIQAAIGAGAGGAAYGQEGAAAGAIAPLLAQALFARGVMRPGVQNYLANQAFHGRVAPQSQMLAIPQTLAVSATMGGPHGPAGRAADGLQR